jgi:DNA invertase Pin-like site-specific DNA recombinase
MTENEIKQESIAIQKSKIRERYKGINSDELDIIPALPQEDFYDNQREKRVAVYARVSTDDPRQTSSYELQKYHYHDVVSRRPDWKLIEIYADEGISGTSLQHRDAFVKMITDCKAGKIDLIVTKSVSRFARNVVDCIGYVRQLAALQPPVGVFFETENIYTLNSTSEMSLSFISTLAQEESHNKSEIMNASIEMRFRRGIFLTPPLLGYDQDNDGNLIINEEEAKIVRLTFFMYLYGYTCQQIADTLTNLGCRTKKDNTTWSVNSILQILQNERHCGDVLARKTWTPSYLDHKSKKNKQDRNQYRQRNHHEPIISRDDFIAVQHLISNAKYGNKGLLPELHVITDGVLKGFVPINPRWAGFKSKDYKAASESVTEDVNSISSSCITAQSGDFDLRGFEIARAQFFDTADRISMTFSINGIKFSTEAIRKLNDIVGIEMLVHPTKLLFAVRPCTNENRNSVQWASPQNGRIKPRLVSGTAYLSTLYDIFGWNPTCKYRVIGVLKKNENTSLIIFNLHETEILIPSDVLDSADKKEKESKKPLEDILPFTEGAKKNVLAYPADWVNGFGNNYYSHSQARELAAFSNNKEWGVHLDGVPYKESELQITDSDDICKSIDELMNDMKQEVNHERNNHVE